MFKFEKALLYYELESFYKGEVCEVNTSMGYMTLDNSRMKCFPLTSLVFPKTAPYFFLRNEGILYLMKKEPMYYA